MQDRSRDVAAIAALTVGLLLAALLAHRSSELRLQQLSFATLAKLLGDPAVTVPCHDSVQRADGLPACVQGPVPDTTHP
jgi:Asp-tRNA(Asn)/Glu-tRNA(Gln) amidotransferase A subunit family amidase